MDLISKQELTQLLDGQPDTPHISIFLPTVRAGAETQQNPIRFKNLLREAHSRLLEKGLEKDAARRCSNRRRALVDDYDFWQHQDDGLAVFSPTVLPATYPCRSSCGAGDRGGPLPRQVAVPAVTSRRRFFLLALSRTGCASSRRR